MKGDIYRHEFFADGGYERSAVEGLSAEFFKSGCVACPLRSLENHTPDMKPSGSEHPRIYMIGEAPGSEEDDQGEPFVGNAGKVLRFRVPREWDELLRWNNVVRTRPHVGRDNREPTPVEIEFCRPSIVKDIEDTKPEAIFGFGNVPLRWVIGRGGITHWTGRRIPVQVGTHKCWYFPMLHPSYVARMRRFEPRTTDAYGSDEEFTFAKHLQSAFDQVEAGLPPVDLHDRDHVLDDCELITGKAPGDLDRVLNYLKALSDEKVVGLDYETKHTRPYHAGAKILTVALSCSECSVAFPLMHRDAGWTEDELDTLLEAFSDFLHDAKCRKVAHYLNFEMEWSAYFFGQTCLHASKWGDTLTQAWVLDERMNCLSLDFLCMQHFGFGIKAISNLDPNRLDVTELEPVLSYNALDAKYHRLLYLRQAHLIKEQDLRSVYSALLRRIPTMVSTQLLGVPIDQEEVKRLFRRYYKRQRKIEDELAALKVVKQFRTLRGQPFRPTALHDLKFILTEILNKRVEQLNEAALQEIDHPVAKTLLRFRKVTKLLSTYIKPLLSEESADELTEEFKIVPPLVQSPHMYPDGLLHQTITTTNTVTSRTSSEDPNLQNVPKRGPGKEVRAVLGNLGDLRIVAFDYSGIQARNIAMELKDRALVKAFRERYDIHGDWAERIHARCPRWVDGDFKDPAVRKKYRDIAKNGFVFPSFFGARAATVAGRLKINERDGDRLQDKLWQMFPDVHGWHESIKQFYLKHGYVTGLSGIRRRAPVAPNQLINAPIQADEALLVCNAMARLSELGDPRFQASMEIHDDLTFIWPQADIERNSEVVITEMLRIEFPWVNVPLGVERSIGADWGTLEKAGEFFSDQWGGKLD